MKKGILIILLSTLAFQSNAMMIAFLMTGTVTLPTFVTAASIEQMNSDKREELLKVINSDLEEYYIQGEIGPRLQNVLDFNFVAPQDYDKALDELYRWANSI